MKRDAGLTLIELVAAMAVFALVAVMGLQSLTGMLRGRDRLAQIDTDTAALTLSVARLRNDLSAALPLLFYPPGRGAPRSAIAPLADGAGFALSVGAQLGVDGQYRSHRSQWRHDPATGTLYRRVWTTLTPASDAARQPDVAVMEGVSDLRLRSYWPNAGWIDGTESPNVALNAAPTLPTLDADSSGGAPEVYSDSLPLAVEISIDTAAYGTLTLIEALQ